MKQQTLTGFERYGKTTRRAQFLADMHLIVPWAELAAVVEPFYPKVSEAGGRPALPLERMLRVYFLQLWFNLSDPAVEEELYDSVSNGENKISEANDGVMKVASQPDPISLEEIRRQARENWLVFRKQKLQGETRIGSERGSDHDAMNEQRHSLEDGAEEELRRRSLPIEAGFYQQLTESSAYI